MQSFFRGLVGVGVTLGEWPETQVETVIDAIEQRDGVPDGAGGMIGLDEYYFRMRGVPGQAFGFGIWRSLSLGTEESRPRTGCADFSLTQALFHRLALP